jgi:hypothetical protein
MRVFLSLRESKPFTCHFLIRTKTKTKRKASRQITKLALQRQKEEKAILNLLPKIPVSQEEHKEEPRTAD